MDLISTNLEKKINTEGPLAHRMRPRSLEQFAGQKHILSEGKPLHRIISSDRIVSLLFFGPPGTGKTSLARIIAALSKASFTRLNAVESGVKEVRKIIEEAAGNWALHNSRTILFIDEIHRFNKAQQDVLLKAVEEGTLIFIGATTENPFFYLTGPLLSRTTLYTFKPLEKNDILGLLKAALLDSERGLGRYRVEIDDKALDYLADKTSGDARAALNVLETAVLCAEEKNGRNRIDLDCIYGAIQERLLSYDRQGDDHYDMASALIKSIRGSDPDAALYWMARMLRGGEDPLFIARRLVISAAEDIGNADPEALPLAVAAAQAVQMIGLPEGRIPLAQAATYLAAAPKSNAAYMAINDALKTVEDEINQQVPRHLKGTGYSGAARLGHGRGYKYPHDYPGHYTDQEYLPPALSGKTFYRPTEQGREKSLKNYLEKIRPGKYRQEKTRD